MEIFSIFVRSWRMFFFFQAEDGIRDIGVTGVQTCALPIYAGTSFLAPPREKLGKTRLGPEFMNVLGDRSQEGGCATIGYDDDGVRPEDFLIIKNGVFNDYQTTREQAPWLDWWYKRQGRPTRSHGCAHADSWSSVQFQRMPNVSLLPGERDIGWEDVIAATDRGIAIVGNGSYSIDQQRYNAQFGGDRKSVV